MEKSDITVGCIDRGTDISEETLQGMVDLYRKHEKLSDDQRSERGLDEVRNIATQIAQGVEFVIAKNNDGEVVGARRAITGVRYEHQTEKERGIWLDSLFVDQNNRGRGIASEIEKIYAERCQRLADKIKARVLLAGGIEPDNTASIEAHKKWGYKIGETYKGSETDGGHEYHFTSKEIEPHGFWERWRNKLQGKR